MLELLDYAPPAVIPVVIGGVALAVAARVLAGFLDVWRIRGYITSAGGQMISCRWWPFGPGWLGEKRDRIYHVAFVDAAGVQHQAYCETSLLTGVYFTQDRVADTSKTPQRLDVAHRLVHEELHRLREENRQLRQQLNAKPSNAADR